MENSQITDHKSQLPLWLFRLLLAAAFCGALGWATRDLSAFLATITTTLSQGGLALLIFIAGGGYGRLALKRILPRDAPEGLRAATACALGLWMLSTAMLAIGTFAGSLLTGWLAWSVVLAGAGLAAWQSWPALRKLKLPARVPYGSLVWLAVAAAAGLWIAGATLPPELVHTPDTYDVLEYHLQLPREMLTAGSTAPLPHNVYSHYPLGSEMLFLLAMVLRGGAYPGLYAVTLIHGMFAALAATALWSALRRDEPLRARASAVLLLTVPLVVSLSWLAMVELAMVCYVTLAVLWLRRWMRHGEWRSAAVIGLLLGAGCAVKYLSVGFLVAPVSAIMLVAPLIRRQWSRLAHLALAAAATVLLFSPWLVRNVADTGNPVFPLATTVFGRGHWSPESQQRWLAGHGPQIKPPVPEPPGWQPQTYSPGGSVLDNFLLAPEMAPWTVVLAAAGLFAAVRADRRYDGWDLALGLILLVQLAVWATFTHGMPTRFLAPALPLLAMLAGGAISRLGGPPDAPLWRRIGAYVPLILVLGANLWIAGDAYRQANRFGPLQAAPVVPIPDAIETQAHLDLSDDARFLLVGDGRAWLWPDGTVYATAFDTHPLAKLAARGETGEQMLTALRARGVDYLFVNWSETWRLAHSYGYPAALSSELFARRAANRPPDLELLARLRAAGLRHVVDLSPAFIPQVHWLDKTGPAWPQATLYALPPEPTTRPTQP